MYILSNFQSVRRCARKPFGYFQFLIFRQVGIHFTVFLALLAKLASFAWTHGDLLKPQE